MRVVEELFELFGRHGGERYVRERISQREHALQAASLAAADGLSPPMVLAALLHDVGHLLEPPADDLAGLGIDHRHEVVGGDWLARHFGPEVTEPVRLHVLAKRYLCASEPGYLDRLSPASLCSLALQGGPLSAREAGAFEANPFFDDALVLRRVDERAKEPGRAVAPLAHYRELVESSVVPQLRRSVP